MGWQEEAARTAQQSEQRLDAVYQALVKLSAQISELAGICKSLRDEADERQQTQARTNAADLRQADFLSKMFGHPIEARQ